MQRSEPCSVGELVEGAPTKPASIAWWHPAVGLLVGGILFWLAARGIDFAAIISSVARASVSWLILSWVAIVAGTLLKGLRWKYLLRVGSEIGWLRLTAGFAVGQFLNALVPARLGELARVYLTARWSKGTAGLALGSIVAEKALDGAALLGAAAGLVLTMAVPDWFGTAVFSFAAILAVVFLVIITIVLARKRLLEWTHRLPARLYRLVEAAVEGLTAIRSPRVLVPAVGLTLLIWALGLASNYALFLSLQLPVGVSGAALLATVYYLGVLIPGVPAQVGLFHYVTVLSLALYGIAAGQAMSYAVVLHALIYGTIALAGGISVAALGLDAGSFLDQLRELAQKGSEGSVSP